MNVLKAGGVFVTVVLAAIVLVPVEVAQADPPEAGAGAAGPDERTVAVSIRSRPCGDTTDTWRSDGTEIIAGGLDSADHKANVVIETTPPAARTLLTVQLLAPGSYRPEKEALFVVQGHALRGPRNTALVRTDDEGMMRGVVTSSDRRASVARIIVNGIRHRIAFVRDDRALWNPRLYALTSLVPGQHHTLNVSEAMEWDVPLPGKSYSYVYRRLRDLVRMLHHWSDLDVGFAKGFPAAAQDLMVIIDRRGKEPYPLLREALDLIVTYMREEYNLKITWRLAGKEVTFLERVPGEWRGPKIDAKRELGRGIPLFALETRWDGVIRFLDQLSNLSIRLEVDEETRVALPPFSFGSMEATDYAALSSLRTVLDALVSSAQRDADLPLRWKLDGTTVVIHRGEGATVIRGQPRMAVP